MTAAIIRPFKLAALALIVTTVLMAVFGVDSTRDLPLRYDQPLLAIEMAHSSGEVARIADGKSTDTRKRFILNTWVDFSFLSAYGAFSFLLARLLRRRRTIPWAKEIGTLAMTTALAGAAFDAAENVALLSVLDAGTAFDWLRMFTLAKWGSIGLTACLLVGLFLRPLPVDTRLKLYCLLAAALYALSGGILLYGSLLDQPFHYSLESGATPLALANLMVICTGLFQSNRDEFDATL